MQRKCECGSEVDGNFYKFGGGNETSWSLICCGFYGALELNGFANNEWNLKVGKDDFEN